MWKALSFIWLFYRLWNAETSEVLACVYWSILSWPLDNDSFVWMNYLYIVTCFHLYFVVKPLNQITWTCSANCSFSETPQVAHRSIAVLFVCLLFVCVYVCLFVCWLGCLFVCLYPVRTGHLLTFNLFNYNISPELYVTFEKLPFFKIL